MVYFDHNATTPLIPEAQSAWMEAAQQWFANPSSPHRLGARAANALDQARERLAAILGCHALDIVWTSGATESNNQVLHHAAAVLAKDQEVWISAMEHPCVLLTAAHLFPGRHRLLPVSREGVVQCEALETLAKSSKPGWVIVMAANNETGVVQPWKNVSAWCAERKVLFHCDAAQWLGKLPAEGLGQCDFVSGCAHKFGGPKGVGFLKCPHQGIVHPLLRGGSQEEGRRAGTENVAGALALVRALEVAEESLKPPSHRAAAARLFRDEFESELRARCPGIEGVGQSTERLWNTSAVLMPEADCQQRWVVRLDREGFAVSTGSACASGREKPSHVLRAMGYSDAEAARMLRFSSGRGTTREDWQQLLAAVIKIAESSQQRVPTSSS